MSCIHVLDVRFSGEFYLAWSVQASVQVYVLWSTFFLWSSSSTALVLRSCSILLLMLISSLSAFLKGEKATRQMLKHWCLSDDVDATFCKFKNCMWIYVNWKTALCETSMWLSLADGRVWIITTGVLLCVVGLCMFVRKETWKHADWKGLALFILLVPFGNNCTFQPCLHFQW